MLSTLQRHKHWLITATILTTHKSSFLVNTFQACQRCKPCRKLTFYSWNLSLSFYTGLVCKYYRPTRSFIKMFQASFRIKICHLLTFWFAFFPLRSHFHSAAIINVSIINNGSNSYVLNEKRSLTAVERIITTSLMFHRVFPMSSSTLFLIDCKRSACNLCFGLTALFTTCTKRQSQQLICGQNYLAAKRQMSLSGVGGDQKRS